MDTNSREGNMKNIGRFAVVALILTTIAIGQSALLAAPVQGAAASAGHSARLSLFDPLFGILAAVWSDRPWNATVTGVPENPGRGRGQSGGGLQQGGSTDAAIWGCGKGNC
jgi:hypothetical protein